MLVAVFAVLMVLVAEPAFSAVSNCDLLLAHQPSSNICLSRNQCIFGHELMTKDSSLGEYEREAVVHVVNILRNLVAKGEVKGPSTRAKNMNQITWSDDIAELARLLAEQCGDPNSPFFNKDMIWKDHFAVGKIEMSEGHPETKYGTTVQLSISKFFIESVFKRPACNHTVTAEDIANFHRVGKHAATNAYAQLIWAESTFVGCGHVEYRSLDSRADPGHNQHTLLLCLFGPGIPFWPKGESSKHKTAIYEIGAPNCNTTSTVYPYLCASEAINEEWTNPCDDEEFESFYPELCEKITYRSICGHHSKGKTLKTMTIWYISIAVVVILVIAAGFAIWYFWEDIEDLFFDW